MILLSRNFFITYSLTHLTARVIEELSLLKKEKRKEKNGVFSGHYVIASSLPPERLRPNDDRWNATCSCQYSSCMAVIAATRADGGLVLQ